MSKDACRSWEGPVVIDGVVYQFIDHDEFKDGTRVWCTSVILASQISGLFLQGSSIEIGCGCGLVGMVANATLLEKDVDTVSFTKKILEMNKKDCELRIGSWIDTSDKFDNIFGSEILYPAYKPETVADFIDRCWTRKGRVELVNSRPLYAYSFENRLNELQVNYVKELKSYQDFEYTQWSLIG